MGLVDGFMVGAGVGLWVDAVGGFLVVAREGFLVVAGKGFFVVTKVGFSVVADGDFSVGAGELFCGKLVEPPCWLMVEFFVVDRLLLVVLVGCFLVGAKEVVLVPACLAVLVRPRCGFLVERFGLSFFGGFLVGSGLRFLLEGGLLGRPGGGLGLGLGLGLPIGTCPGLPSDPGFGLNNGFLGGTILFGFWNGLGFGNAFPLPREGNLPRPARESPIPSRSRLFSFFSLSCGLAVVIQDSVNDWTSFSSNFFGISSRFVISSVCLSSEVAIHSPSIWGAIACWVR